MDIVLPRYPCKVFPRQSPTVKRPCGMHIKLKVQGLGFEVVFFVLRTSYPSLHFVGTCFKSIISNNLSACKIFKREIQNLCNPGIPLGSLKSFLRGLRIAA